VPNYAAGTFSYLGAMVFVLIGIELVTGFLLGLYYVPDASGNPAPAYTSVIFIQNTAYLGWLIRGIHFWGANLLIAMALLYLIRMYWTGSYRAPREINWIVGVAMFLVILTASITGELLPWNTASYFARSRELSIATGGSILPLHLGSTLKYLLQGGPIVGPATLQRFFMAHVVLLPAVLSFLMYVHFRLTRAQGTPEPM
jgi:menaquinol-cytochrome c reductase cytochrome b subunit